MSLMKTKLLRSTLLAGLASIAAAPASTAFAQAAAGTQADDDQDVIVVTGSRIRRESFADIPQPAIVTDEEYLDRRGFTNLNQALFEVPGFNAGSTGNLAGQNATGSNQNVGQEFPDLYNLGTQRTLVVVNGRRVTSANILSGNPTGRAEGLQVDLNMFPVAMVDRIETISVGGATTYGADAIAGTVNIILKEDFEGVDASVQYGNGIGVPGQDTWLASAVMGANTSDGRGNVTAAIEFTKQEGALANDFPLLFNQRSCIARSGPCEPSTAPGIFNLLEGPDRFLPTPGPGFPLPAAGSGINVFKDADGNILSFGGEGGQNGRLSIHDPGSQPCQPNTIFCSGGSGFRPTDFEEAIVPIDRFVFATNAHYEVTDNIRMYAQTNFLRTESRDLISQVSSAFNTSFLNTQGIGSAAVSIDHPFLHPDDRQTLIDGGSGDEFFLHGIRLDLLPPSARNFTDTTIFRLAGGLQGEFEKWGREFNWDAYYSYGQTNQSRRSAEIRGGAFKNSLQAVRLDASNLSTLQDPDNVDRIVLTTNRQTIDVVRGTDVLTISPFDAQAGDVICSVFLDPPGPVDEGVTGLFGSNVPTPDSDVANCVPFNPFGTEPINANRAAADFLNSSTISLGEIAQSNFVIDLTGELFELPAGWVSFNVGFERRRDFGSFESGGVLQDGLSRAVAVPDVPFVETVSNEYFGEVIIPVLGPEHFSGINDSMGFELFTGLEWTGAYRLIDQSRTGQSNVYTAGGTLKMLGGDLTLRGNFTHTIRAPSIVELFAPRALTFDQTGDPCDATNINDDGANAPRIANCLTRAQQLGFTDAAIIDDPANPGQVLLELTPGAGGFTTGTVNAAIAITSSGNPDLRPEIANSYTGGFIYSPSQIPGLTMNVDFISINLRDQISDPDFGNVIVANCFDDSDFAAGDLAPECALFERAAFNFDIVTGGRVFQNLQTQEFKAIQAQMSYGFSVNDAYDFVRAGALFGNQSGDLGNVRTNLNVFKPVVLRGEDLETRSARNGRLANTVGVGEGLGATALTMRASIFYEKGPFFMLWSTEYLDDLLSFNPRIEGDESDRAPEQFVIEYDLEHDVTVGWEFDDRFSAQFTVNDVMGNRPTLNQEIFSGLTTGHGRFTGRTFREDRKSVV